MIGSRDLAKIAVKVADIRTPVKLNRPLGYDGFSRFVIAYWDMSVDDVCLQTELLGGSTGGAWWAYTDLVEDQASHEIAAALVACGARNLKEHWPLGNSESEAYMGLILDRFDHELWVAHLDDAFPLLLQQPVASYTGLPVIVGCAGQAKKSAEGQSVPAASKRCDCIQGWLTSMRKMPACLRALE